MNESQVKEILSTVMYPGFQKDIVTFNFVIFYNSKSFYTFILLFCKVFGSIQVHLVYLFLFLSL
jgi:hypothetical protein